MRQMRQQHHSVAARQLRPDQVAIAVFDARAREIHTPAPPYSASLQKMALSLPSLATGGSTNIAAGIREGIRILRQAPRGYYRRMWVLSDGEANVDANDVIPAAMNAKDNWININTVALSTDCDLALMRRISSVTHNGKAIALADLRALTDVIISHSRPSARGGTPRPEATVIVVDTSISMTTKCAGGKSRIELVAEAVLRLLVFKQQCFA